jgi:hypothetical protein
LFGQQPISGIYDDGLSLAFDSTSRKVTGYFEEYAGSSEQKNSPHFSCVFYVEGTMTGQKFTIKTYDPTDKKNDFIQGTMEIVENKKVKIKLLTEHGGCWNVQPFAGEAVGFTLGGSESWIQIRYVDVARSYFHANKAEDSRLKSYLIRGNVVCIEKIQGQWVYCNLLGKKTKGWLKITDLNTL